MRFWNRDVGENLDGVFAAIETALKKIPSPLVGEGGPKDRMRGSAGIREVCAAPLTCLPASSPCERGEKNQAAFFASPLYGLKRW
jgi:hypothetical protein